MSRFRGFADDRWTLHEMLDELREAARRAARPGWIWLAGFLYPSIVVLPAGVAGLLFIGDSTVSFEIPVDDASTDAEALVGLLLGLLVSGVVLALALILPSRLNAGLARLAPAAVWDRIGGERGRPGFRDCWRAGYGSTFSVLGLRCLIGALRYAVFLVMLLPAAFAWNVLESLSAQGPGAIVMAIVALPALACLLIYNLILSLLQQLALQSLVHNRRGVSSALQHAWSILRQDPWAGGRTMTGEILLAVLALVLGGAMYLLSIGPLIALGWFAAPAALLLKLAAFGFACILGVTRACYWAAAYRALGGLSPDDGVPGLEGLRDAPAES